MTFSPQNGLRTMGGIFDSTPISSRFLPFRIACRSVEFASGAGSSMSGKSMIKKCYRGWEGAKCHKSPDSHFYGAKGQEMGLRHHDFKVDLRSCPSTQSRGGNVTFAPHVGACTGWRQRKTPEQLRILPAAKLLFQLPDPRFSFDNTNLRFGGTDFRLPAGSALLHERVQVTPGLRVPKAQISLFPA